MNIDWLLALLGGGAIGLAATLFLFVNGRIAGISGIFFGLIQPKQGDRAWRLLFIAGLMTAGALTVLYHPDGFANLAKRPWGILLAAGFLVGFGTRMGGGCTSGHGICGISRLSPRSITATLSFVISGVVTVALYRFITGGV